AGAAMPSSALIDRLLREVTDDPDLVLGERTIETYCEHLRESARLLADCSLTTNRIDRIESFHYLLLMTAYAVEAAITNHDPLEPMWCAPSQFHLLDWGGASPDGVYRRAMVRDDHAYRVWGAVGNASYFSMDFRLSRPMVTIMTADLDLDAGGNFEIFIGGSPRDRQWWPLHPGTTGLTTREFFDDWIAARRSRLRIECLDGDLMAPRPEHNAARVAAEFDAVSDWILEGGIRFWITQSLALEQGSPNRFQPELARTDTKLPVVTTALWRLAPDEALIIELPDPEADFWGYQLASSLWHTLDYANRITSLNHAQLQPDPDGLFRVVLAHRDPGVANWLDTTGLERGVLILRFCGAKAATVPKTRLVRLPDIGSDLPGVARFGTEARRAQIAERREGVAHMVCD
ncbi:MAG TPA: hypothetical protein VK461_12595, partial [Acidimicrobiales bacterium]|nr:hypothetical protein [Acidimicrobiales bacterium]